MHCTALCWDSGVGVWGNGLPEPVTLIKEMSICNAQFVMAKSGTALAQYVNKENFITKLRKKLGF